MALLCAAAGWLGRAQQFELLPLGASAGAFGVVLVWLLSTGSRTALAWEAFGICLRPGAAVPCVCRVDDADSEIAGAPPGNAPARSATIATRPALVTALGFLLLLAVRPAAESDRSVWPWMCAWVVLAALLLRQSALPAKASGRSPPRPGWGWVSLCSSSASANRRAFPPLALFLGLAVAGVRGVPDRSAVARGPPECAAWPISPPQRRRCFCCSPSRGPCRIARMPPWLYMTVDAGAGSAGRAGRDTAGRRQALLRRDVPAGRLPVVWTTFSASPLGTISRIAATALGLQLLAVVLFTFWPFLAGPRLLATGLGDLCGGARRAGVVSIAARAL